MAALTRSSVLVAILAICILYVWSKTEASPAPKATGKAGFRTDLEEVIASAKEANDFLNRDAKRGLRSKLGKYLFGRRRHHHRGGEEEEGYGRYEGGYYGGRYGDRYGDPYGGRYGDRYGSRYGHRYGSRYGSRYEEYEE
ncbi:protein suex-1-like isoform X2 [Liolophura sinensis]|uniref:protein suex-1-like isoform X2 n=1 Tax=Liolophura sinensis TaxID=3198878 RepID=UPI003158890A